ncbi:Long-chain-fatty-acid--CoA ligase 5 [Toxocara canis]|uniref:long-chain-fatty-acid--CoA ligase n=1 Tax=Toxocara canis TaxID=6265 RepID=A0A0B2UYH7_TOXCA|nr:Long-chain-fatty-acid--CoA ligase 5 [Toxocara canis]
MPISQRSLPNFPRFSQYSRILPGAERVHHSVLVKPNDLIEYPPDGSTTTIFELLQRAVAMTNDGEFIGERDSEGAIQWITYKQAVEDAQRIGSALLHLGVGAGEATRVGIAGLNSSRYMIAQYALVSYSIVLVPLYYNYKTDALCEIINSCGLEVIFCDTTERAEAFVKCINDGLITTLTKIIVMKPSGSFRNGSHQKCSAVELYNWDYMLTIGSAHLKPATPPAPSTIYIICHTSGTTGHPKGVELSHRALLASMAGLYVQWCMPPHSMHFDNTDVHLSFLSLAHVYEQLLELFMMYVGGRIGIFGGDVRKLLDDMILFRPTIVALVPRLLSRFHEMVVQEIAHQSPLKRLLFGIAVKSKMNMLSKGKMCFNTIWDRLVFNKIHAKFGGNIRLLTTGGAPLSKELMRFSRIAYGCPVFEGYGQTECSAAGTINLPFDVKSGHVGGPAPWAQVKLVDVEELAYSAENDVGEVCFRGAALMNGYFNDPELTAKVIDEEGWLHTGDIGKWLPNGSLRIIDRKNNFFKLSQGDFVSPEQGWLHTGDIGKWLPNGSLRIIDRKNNFFKLSQGDFVSPEQVENVYSQHPIVKQIFVYGSPLRAHLVAIVVVDVTLLRKQYISAATHADNVAESPSTVGVLCDVGVRKKFLLDLCKFGSTKGLTGIEQIHNVHLLAEEFTAESGLLTSTLKIKREVLADRFATTIERLYSEDLHT